MSEENLKLQAATLVNLDCFKEAEVLYLRLLASDPTNAGVLEQLSRICYNTKRQKEGLKYAKSAIVADPESYYAHYLVAYGTYIKSPKVAKKHIESALKIAPHFSNALYLKALIEVNEGKHVVALETISHGLRVNPNGSQLLALRTRILTTLGRHSEATESAKAALRFNALDSDAHSEFAQVKLHTGDIKESIARYREALRLNPNNEEARHGLMNALRAKNPIFRLTLKLALTTQRLPARYRPLIGIVGVQLIRALFSPAKGTSLEMPAKIVLGVLIVFGLAVVIFVPLLCDVLLAFTDEGRALFPTYTRPIKPIILGGLGVMMVSGLVAFFYPLAGLGFFFASFMTFFASLGYSAKDADACKVVSLLTAAMICISGAMTIAAPFVKFP